MRLTGLESPAASTKQSLANNPPLKLMEPDVSPVRLPLTLRLLSTLPLIISVTKNEAGSYSGLAGHLWVAGED